MTTTTPRPGRPFIPKGGAETIVAAAIGGAAVAAGAALTGAARSLREDDEDVSTEPDEPGQPPV